MQEFVDRVAVVTGAASGIGRALAERAATEGMKVVLADVEERSLAQAAREMEEAGATVLPVRTDVSRAEDVQALAQKTLSAFGGVHLLCNNAGVAVHGMLWGSSIKDWQWVMGVNLFGVIHGVHTFVPIMLEQGAEGHIVNTASVAGLLPVHLSMATYAISKHAVVGVSEQLYLELAQRKAKIGVSVLCPSSVNTRLGDAARNRPEQLKDEIAQERDEFIRAAWEREEHGLDKGAAPEQVAEAAFQGIRDEQLYILPHHGLLPLIKARFEGILEQRNPDVELFTGPARWGGKPE
jgi:NAD(P)-dependent dehydrogenase (short-subunit alcohol dehydrogenase family)